MIIAKGITIAATPTITGSAGAEVGAANLLTPSPKEVWVAPLIGTYVIDFDLGAVQDWDTVFLGFTTATTGASWRIQKATGLGTGLTDVVAAGTTFRAADSLGPRHHGFASFAPVANTRYGRISITQTGAVPIQIGSLLVSKAFVFPYEFGSGRQPIDTGIVEELQDGGFGIGEGVVKQRLQWTFVDLQPADRRTLDALVRSVGRRKPIVVHEQLGEGASGLNEEIHYGLFDRFESYERQAASSTRWSLSMTEWL